MIIVLVILAANRLINQRPAPPPPPVGGDQVRVQRVVDGDTLLAYHASVIDTANAYLNGAPLDDLARVAPSPTLGTAHTVQQRLVGVLNEGFQHLGQIRLTY